jgi:hypothetical protein
VAVAHLAAAPSLEWHKHLFAGGQTMNRMQFDVTLLSTLCF